MESRMEEMLQVLKDVLSYEDLQISMYEDMILRDIQGVLETIKEQGSITLEEVELEH